MNREQKHESEIKELRDTIVKQRRNYLQAMKAKDEDIDDLNSTINQLHDQIYRMERESEKC